MPRIKIGSLKAGMTVASDVMNGDNMLLIPKGCALSERQIGILQAWGVEAIDVRDSSEVEDTDPLARLGSEELNRLTSEVVGWFWQADETSPVFVETVKLLVKRRAAKLGGRMP